MRILGYCFLKQSILYPIFYNSSGPDGGSFNTSHSPLPTVTIANAIGVFGAVGNARYRGLAQQTVTTIVNNLGGERVNKKGTLCQKKKEGSHCASRNLHKKQKTISTKAYTRKGSGDALNRLGHEVEEDGMVFTGGWLRASQFRGAVQWRDKKWWLRQRANGSGQIIGPIWSNEIVQNELKNADQMTIWL